MIIYTSTNDYGKMPPEIRDFLQARLDTGECGLFDYLFGGDVHQVENITEISDVRFDSGCLADTIMTLDAVERLDNFTIFFMATNDSGGISYFIPNGIVDTSIVLTDTFHQTRAEYE